MEEFKDFVTDPKKIFTGSISVFSKWDFYHGFDLSRVRIHDDNTVGKEDCLFNIMRDKDDGFLCAVADVQDIILQFHSCDRIKCSERLIHE